MKKSIITLLILLTAASSHVLAAQADHIQVTEAWIRAMPPGQTSSAAYFKLKNTGKELVILTAVKANHAGKVMMHESMEHHGNSHMKHLSHVAINPGQTVEFKPSDKHVMLMGISNKEALKPSAEWKLELVFKDQSQLNQTVYVVKK